MGLTQGIHTTLSASIWAVFFGTRHLGSIRAATAAVMVFGTAFGPGVTGVLIDLGFDYDQQLLGLAAYFVAAGILAAVAAEWGRRALPWTPKVDVERA
jgi:MFS family permease